MTNLVAPSPAGVSLAGAQNKDGGWGYRGGSSWTEPTAFALLALSGQADSGPALQRARKWLAGCLRPDGGFAPRPDVADSTWVTALVLLAGACPHGSETRAREWLLAQSNRDAALVFRLRQWMLGNSRLSDAEAPGWSWFPGTAAWVVPTSLSILALEKAGQRQADPRIQERIAKGRTYLLARRCEDGGWNHGSSKALGYQAVSYPETTGIALTALRGLDVRRLEKSLARAREHLRTCRSLEGANWLRLGLLAHGEDAPDAGQKLTPRTLLDTALGAIARRAAAGPCPLWEAAR
ncbi:MAG TPA: prenyltransferase/squalene oxidase repeat-containing protein [Bryobacteraceae bacterium]|nr:prenyltransferase/squalene oxidase repeat-containing protein [Bryobacteraceae bacterium]